MLTNRNKVPDPVRLPLCLGLPLKFLKYRTNLSNQKYSWTLSKALGLSITTDFYWYQQIKKKKYIYIGENSTDISPVTQHANNQKGWRNTFWCRSKPSIFLGVWQSPPWWCPAQGSSVSTLRASNPLMDCRPLPPAVETQAVWNLCLNICCIVSGGHSFILLLQ